MKNILTLLCVFAACSCLFRTSSYGQCTAEITGNNCGGNVITAHINNGTPKEILWIRDGSPCMIRINYPSIGNVITTGLDVPSGIAFDKDSNMYVSEYRNNSVVKFAKNSKVGVVVAGGNGQGDELDQLNGPEDIEVDKHGNIFIADVYNYRVVVWAPGASTGKVVAGGNGPGSELNQFNWPNSVSLDSAGNIYVADVFNNRVIKWPRGATEGVVVAGGNGYGAAADQLYHPMDVFVDKTGNMLISDFLNYRVQKWAPGAETGVTVAGGNGFGNAPNKIFPEEIFVDDQNNLFVIDAYSHGIKKWLPGRKNACTIAGGYGLGYSPYQLYFPRGLAVSASGTVFVVVGGDGEPGHGFVEVFDPTNIADTNFFTADKKATYKAVVLTKEKCKGITPLFDVITKPLRPSPILGIFTVEPKQSNLTYSVIGKPEYTYEWTFPEGVDIVSGQGTSVVTVNWGETSGIISVHASNNCGSSEDRNAFVQIRSIINNSSSFKRSNAPAKQFSVFPNPAVDKITLSYDSYNEESVQIKITDLTGKLLIHQTFFAATGNITKQVDVTKLSPGVYTLNVYGKKTGLRSAKILKH